jgi:UDP-2,3-diacylglucosamine pyrophosphatase LpxH
MSALKALVIIGIILTASGFTSDILGEYLGPIEYKGYIVFDYPEGENPINNIVFTVDSTLAGSLIIVNVPAPWSHSYGGGILTLTGGSVGPGGSVRVTVSLNRYFEDGEYPVSSVGTTTVGEVSQASGPLLVGELYLLNFLGMASAYRFPLAALVAGLGVLELLLSRRKRDSPDDVQTGRMTVDTVYDTVGDTTRVVDDESGEVHLRRDGMGRVIDSSFSEASGLEVETPDIDYRTGTDSGPSTRKMSGMNKFTNITMKRGVVGSLDTDELQEEESILPKSPSIEDDGDSPSFTSGSGTSSDETVDTVDEEWDTSSEEPETLKGESEESSDDARSIPEQPSVPVPVDGKTGDDDRVELQDDKEPVISTEDKKDEPPSTRTREQESTTGKSRDGDSDTTTTDDDGDDPRDIPPPTIYGEEIDVDPIVPPVYIVSDFHIGSNSSFPGQVDKKLSNDMDKKTLENFLKWLDLVDKDAVKYDHYDVVMNGDFLDLWQATRPKDDDYQKRLEDILETNQVSNNENKNFFSELGRIIRKNSPRGRFYYVIGNHDDALYSGNHEGDNNFGEGNSFNSLRNMVTGKLRDGNTSLMSFAMNRQYTNANYKLYVEHGHQHDATNMKDENGGPSGGQLIAQQINHMQEIDPLFENIEKTPNQETAKYLKCLVDHPETPENIKNEIDQLKEISIDAEAYVIGNIVDMLLTDEGMSNAIIDRIDPENINRNELEEALEIINDVERIPQRKIVVFGHTHIHDLQPPQPYSQWAYVNSGTWLDDINLDSSDGCQLKSSPSKLPYVKISKEEGEDIALVELKFFKGTSKDRLVKVRLS